MLASIGQLFDGPRPVVPEGSPLPRLTDWATTRWAASVSGAGTWPVDAAQNRVAFGFRLTTEEGEAPNPLPLTTLDQAIRDASWASERTSRGGNGAFIRGHAGLSRPGVLLVEGREAYAATQPASAADYLLPWEWYVRDDGLGVELSGLPEDNPWVKEALAARGSRRWPAGERIAPSFEVGMTAERVAFVASLAARYPDATRCELLVDYVGLAGRHLDETAPGAYFSIDRTSREDARRVSIEIGVAALTAELPEVVAALVGPVFRLLEWEVGSDYVRNFLTGGRR